MPDDAQTRHLAEIGVVFLMFLIGLEFSLPKLRVMRREVFGLGSSQMAITLAACVEQAPPRSACCRAGNEKAGAKPALHAARRAAYSARQSV